MGGGKGLEKRVPAHWFLALGRATVGVQALRTRHVYMKYFRKKTVPIYTLISARITKRKKATEFRLCVGRFCLLFLDLLSKKSEAQKNLKRNRGIDLNACHETATTKKKQPEREFAPARREAQ